MKDLALNPGYEHMFQQPAPKSALSALDADQVFAKLGAFLAISEHQLCPAEGWKYHPRDNNHRSLFMRNGFHYPVCWMPKSKLKSGWRRLNYAEFCTYYGLKP